MDDWIVLVIRQCMRIYTTTMVKVDGQHSKALSVIEISSRSSVIRQENSEPMELHSMYSMLTTLFW